MFYKHVFICSNIHICITDRPIGCYCSRLV